MINFAPLDDLGGTCNVCGASNPIGQLEIGKKHVMVSRLCEYCLKRAHEVLQFQLNAIMSYRKHGNVRLDQGFIHDGPVKRRKSLVADTAPKKTSHKPGDKKVRKSLKSTTEKGIKKEKRNVVLDKILAGD